MPDDLLALDLMDTVVRDPFFHHLPRHLGISVDELTALLDGEAWVAFERGRIDEEAFLKRALRASALSGPVGGKLSSRD